MQQALEAALATRREELVRTPLLQRLAARLAGGVAHLCADPVYFPMAKALLSRDGGVCPADGSRLAFHPAWPDRHRCERCGLELGGERHHRAWVTRYQLWLSERAVHLALLGALRDEHELSGRAAVILEGYAVRYRSYPNADNVLGPTRPFFSTYLESIWLTQLAIAASILECAAPSTLSHGAWRAVRQTLTESAELVGSFDEGWSNRQVWHDTALIAAGSWLDREDLSTAGFQGPSGVLRLLQAVDEDGMWHEGENYHLFALRGFLLAAEVLRWSGTDLYRTSRLGRMFGAPLATLLPDLTLPARGDAPFGVSVRQPRFAELWELGRARTEDRRLPAVLARLYAPEAPDADDDPLTEIAEQEQNRAAHRQHRYRLGWKALWWMRPEDPEGNEAWARSHLLERQGAAVLRPDPRRVVTLECGRRGGGHAHPDWLHVSLFWERPVLADFGTGSYVQPSLHWYRSSLAHNAPALAGVGQLPGSVACDGFAVTERWSWCRARAEGVLGDGSIVTRGLIVGPACVVDILELDVPPGALVDLPLHPLHGVSLPTMGGSVATPPVSGVGHETGYDRVTWLGRVTEAPRGLPLDPDGQLELHVVPRAGEQWLLASAPGPPRPDFGDGEPLAFLVRRAAGSGRWVQAVTLAADGGHVTGDGSTVVVRVAGRTVHIEDRPEGVTIAERGAPPVHFAARHPPPAAPARARDRPPIVRVPLVSRRPSLRAWPVGARALPLGELHYRRSEVPYGGRGRFEARLEVIAAEDALWFRFEVGKDDVIVRAVDAPDPALDNEPADIHSDGVQCYVGRERWSGYLVVPDFAARAVRARPVSGTAAERGDVTGESERTAGGYVMVVGCSVGGPLRPGDRVRFTAVVNEMAAGRERRAGQLALAGGGWVYLRGDRESPEFALVAEIT